jgi:hypothetical protein
MVLDLKGWDHYLEVRKMNDIWDGTAIDLTWLNSKTPIGVLEKNLVLASHRYYLWERMLRINQAAAANPPFHPSGVERSPPWLAINSTENTLRWMLSHKQLKEREQPLKEKVERWGRIMSRLKDLIKQQSNRPTPAAAAASEEYQ